MAAYAIPSHAFGVTVNQLFFDSINEAIGGNIELTYVILMLGLFGAVTILSQVLNGVHNFVNIIASRNELLYRALEIAPERMRYCKKMDEVMVSKLNERKPTTMEEIEKIWYEGYPGSTSDKYHPSRYAFLYG